MYLKKTKYHVMKAVELQAVKIATWKFQYIIGYEVIPHSI